MILSAVYSKYDLIYQDYTWTEFPEHDPRVHGEPSETPFNRHEGEEVVYMIRVMCEKYPFLAVRSFCNRIEQLLHNQLPPEKETQIDVFVWLLDQVVNHF